MKNKIFIISICNLFICFAPGELLFAQSNVTYDAGSSIDISTGADVCADVIVINGSYTGGGTICMGSLPVTMSSFTASVLKNYVKLEWTTEVELNNSGFELERKTTPLIPGTSEWMKIAFVKGSGTTNEPKSYFFEDKKLQTGKYQYRLKQIDYNGNFEYFTLETDVLIKAPGNFSVSQNYPNPSNPKSRIDYQIPFTGKVSLKVYDLLGREISILVNEIKDAGYFSAEFDGTNLSSGAYFYRITVEGNAQNFTKTLKMILVK